MLNIYIPKEPKLKDYGISEQEIPMIEKCVIKPYKKAIKREDILFRCSFFLFLISIYFLFIFYLYQNNGWYIVNENSNISIFFFAGLIVFLFWFPFPIGFIGVKIIQYILNKLLPLSFLHDTPDKYSEKDKEMIIKKEQLSLYKTAHAQWCKDFSRINKEYPNAEKIIPIGMDVQDSFYQWYELQYTRWCIINVFMPDFKKKVEYADKLDIKRSQEDWWRNLSPYDFEKETGNWFLNKGYIVNVTQPNIDGGVDIIVSKDGVKSYVQCKHYKDLVPVNVVRELKGVMSIENITSGYLVCINGCTTGAIDFAKKSNIIIITLRDLVNGNINKKSVGRELKDIEHIFKFGEYSIFQFPIKDLEDAETRVKDFTKWLLNREGKAFGLFKCYSFYILVYSFVNSLTRLKNVYKVYDGVSGKTIKSGIVIKNHQVDNIPYTSSSKRNYKVRKRNYKSW